MTDCLQAEGQAIADKPSKGGFGSIAMSSNSRIVGQACQWDFGGEARSACSLHLTPLTILLSEQGSAVLAKPTACLASALGHFALSFAYTAVQDVKRAEQSRAEQCAGGFGMPELLLASRPLDCNFRTVSSILLSGSFALFTVSPSTSLHL